MTEQRLRNEGRETAIRTLQEFGRWLDSDPEVIESMSSRELYEEMREMGLDPDRPIPHLPGRAVESPSIDARLRLGSEKIVLDTIGALPATQAVPPGEPTVGTTPTVGVDRTRLLIAYGPAGECTRQPIGALLREPGVRQRLRSYCFRFSFSCFGGSYGPEDLYQDTCLKVWKYRNKLVAPGNILSDKDLAGWLFIVTRTQYYKRIRQLNRFQTKGVKRWDQPIEDLNLAAPEEHTDGKYFFSRFLDFVKGYPEPRQWTINLWLQGYSYREIETKLKSRDVRCSHVTVRTWIINAVDAFRRTLEAYETEPARSRALAARLFQGQDGDEAM